MAGHVPTDVIQIHPHTRTLPWSLIHSMAEQSAVCVWGMVALRRIVPIAQRMTNPLVF